MFLFCDISDSLLERLSITPIWYRWQGHTWLWVPCGRPGCIWPTWCVYGSLLHAA